MPFFDGSRYASHHSLQLLIMFPHVSSITFHYVSKLLFELSFILTDKHDLGKQLYFRGVKQGAFSAQKYWQTNLTVGA